MSIMDDPKASDFPTEDGDPRRRCLAWGAVVFALETFIYVQVVNPLWHWADAECRGTPLGRPWWTNPMCWVAIFVNVFIWVLALVITYVFYLVCRRWEGSGEDVSTQFRRASDTG